MSGLDVVDVELLALVVAVVAVVAVLVELEADALVALVAVRVRLVDLCVFGELAVGLQTSGFVCEGGRLARLCAESGYGGRTGRVLENHVTLLVLVITEGEQDDVALIYPHLLPELSSNVPQSPRAVEALRFQAAVAQHLCRVSLWCLRRFATRRRTFRTWAYSWPSSLKVSSRFSLSFSFFPLRRFLPPCTSRSVCASRQQCDEASYGGAEWRGSGLRAFARTFPLFLGMVTCGGGWRVSSPACSGASVGRRGWCRCFALCVSGGEGASGRAQV